ANGLYSLRREALRDGALSDHDAEVLQRAVDLYNKASGASVPLTFVNLTREYPGLGAGEMTVRFDQGELGVALAGRPEPALTFHRFLKRQGLEAAFRNPSSPRHLPYVAGDDRTGEGRTLLDALNELDLGQDG